MGKLSRKALIPLLSLLAIATSIPAGLFASGSGDSVTASPGVFAGASYKTFLTVTNGGGKNLVGLKIWTNQPYIESVAGPLGWTSTLTPWGTPITYVALWTADSKIFSITRGASNSQFSMIVSTLNIQLSWCTYVSSSGGSMKANTCGVVAVN